MAEPDITQDTGLETVHRDKVGWRRERPSEDPEKMKRWGLVSAQPSEYLVHYRSGKLREKSSGQGATCFKLPWDSVAIVPTTLKEVFFEANQITKDNIEVRIKGGIVYHIEDPIQAYKLINFSFRERAEEKLSMTMADMCRANAKALVANMTMEECVRCRKEQVSTVLKEEMERVLAGVSDDDRWGIRVDSIDIIDVYIISDEIFEAIQEQFKNEKRREAEHSRIATEREISQKRIENEKATRMQEIEVKATTAIEQAKGDERINEAKKDQQLKELANKSEIQMQAIDVQKEQDLASVAAEEEKSTREVERDRCITELKHAFEEIQFALDRYRVQQNEEIAADKTRFACERAEMEAAQKLKTRELEVKGAELSHNEQTTFERQMREIDNAVDDARLQEEFISEALPAIAQAFAAQFGRIHYTHLGGGDDKGGPLGVVAQAFNQVLEVARLHGIDVSGLLAKAGQVPAPSQPEEG